MHIDRVTYADHIRGGKVHNHRTPLSASRNQRRAGTKSADRVLSQRRTGPLTRRYGLRKRGTRR